MKVYDTIIVGAGPVGLFAAFNAGMRKLDAVVLESLPYIGGQLTTIYAEKPIYDVPGFSSIKAKDFIQALYEQYARFQASIPLYTDCKVIRVWPWDLGYRVETAQGTFYGKTLLFSSGNGDYNPRKLPLKNADSFANIHYRLAELAPFQDKRVVVLGGGDSAVDLALLLRTVTPHVTLVHRREEFRAHGNTVDELKASATVLTPYQPIEIRGADGHASELVIQHREHPEITQVLAVDAILVNYGFLPAPSRYQELGIRLEEGKIPVNSQMVSTIPNLFAAGNITTYPGKITTLAVGLGEAVIAISSINQYLHPEQTLPPLYSSLSMAPKR
jgi:thioredoxin reductase (NADPH)